MYRKEPPVISLAQKETMVFNDNEGFVGQVQDDGEFTLDGRSLIVPEYGDADDMSSLGANSKFTRRGDRDTIGYIGDMKIVGKKSDSSKMSSLEKKLTSYQGDPEIQNGDYGVEIFDNSLAIAQRKDTDLSQSFEEKNNENKNGKKSRCVPQWIVEAPLWLKLVIIASIALLVGALVLIVVGALLSRENIVTSSTQDNSPIGNPGSQEDSAPESSLPQSEPLSDTLSPDKPAVMATSTPSSSPPFTSNASAPTTDETLPPKEEISNLANGVPTNAPSSKLNVAGTLNPKDITSTASPTESDTTDYPTLSPTTKAPTSSPTNSPTTADPTNAPTSAPTTAEPTLSPTKNPTRSPTLSPTKNPTSSPTLPPTKAPTQSPTISMINFFVMGGRFDGDDRNTLASGLLSLPSFDENTILVHLGDWNSPYTTSCVESSFLDNVDIYQKSSVPVYFVPGDNEYNGKFPCKNISDYNGFRTNVCITYMIFNHTLDCPNPIQALSLWNQYFLNFETNYWQEPSWEVLRQLPNYGENFAFLQREVLFLGINLVGGIVHNQQEWDSRHQANLLWIDTTAAKYAGSYTTMVVLAHADPDIEINQNFFQDFYPMVESYDEQVIFVHRNLGIDTWTKESGYNGIQNLEVVAVEGSKWPPMWVQIDPSSGSYNIDQSDWYGSYISKGKLPRSP